MPRDRFDGEIAGFGTTSGTRVVIGRWVRSPYGAFADAMVEHPSGRRVLIAPDDDVAGYVSSVYSFDETIVAAVSCTRSRGSLQFGGGPLHVELTVGSRRPLGWVLGTVPRRLAAEPAWAALLDPLVRRVLRGVRTRGTTAGGREWYGATDIHRLDAVVTSWCGQDLGTIAAVDPPVRFGFGSAPRRPSIVAVTTTVQRQ